KMSKSKGNTIDPLDLIDGIELDALVSKSTAALLIPQVKQKVEKRIRRDYPDGIPAVGADALRFTFAALATHGRTINFDMKRCEGYKNFCNKLWNAARFIGMNLEGAGPRAQGPAGIRAPAADPSVAERWIVGRLVETCRAFHQQIDEYRFDLAAQAAYSFVWDEFCDWFVELAKPALQGGSEAEQASMRHTLLHVLEAVLRLLHPIIPFITEEIWQSFRPHFGVSEAYLGQAPLPYRATDPAPAADAAAASDIAWLQQALIGLRRIRGEMNLAPSREVPLLLQGGDDSDRARSQRFADAFRVLAKVAELNWLAAGEEAPPAAVALVGELKLLIPLAGLIDVEAELKRLDKEIGKVEQDLARAQGKLSNPKFVDGAPAAVVAQEQQRVAEFGAKAAELRAQRDRLAQG
ncbi:MAG: class I tRNA ligase family protein, partial [Xanthomonadales bacterium]|nr:class I tRNA ligase family protein [Xanthomonadales bacterium]